MDGLMQEYPLTLPMIFRRAERLFADKKVTSVDHVGRSQRSVGEWCERTRRLAGALDELGVSEDGRVGTFAWNNARHLECYFGVPCAGRVLHTLNVRLFADQLSYIVSHAGDEVIFVDRSLLAVLWPLVDGLRSVRRYVVMDDGAGDLPDDPRLVDYEDLLAASSPVDL
ncbi:MAG: AMP-binding protein, partial [Acidimicrobiales bacterium]